MKKNSKEETRRKALQAKSRKMKLTVGIDLGDAWSQCCCLGENGEVIEEFRVKTTREALRARLGDLKPMVIALEVGTHSRWVPGTESNRRRQPFQGCLPTMLSGSE